MLEKIINIICDYVDVDPETITADSSLRVDVGATSFDLMNIAVAMEAEFGLNVPDERLVTIKTVGDIAALVEERVMVKS